MPQPQEGQRMSALNERERDANACLPIAVNSWVPSFFFLLLLLPLLRDR